MLQTAALAILKENVPEATQKSNALPGFGTTLSQLYQWIFTVVILYVMQPKAIS